MGYYILIGFFIQIFLEYFSGGIEHGHIHLKDASGTIPWGLFISLSVHSIIEGIPLETQFHGDELLIFQDTIDQQHGAHLQVHSHGQGKSGLLLGIILHKLPVAIALMTLMLASGFSKSKAWIVLFVFSLMSPIGVALGHFGASNYLIDLEILFAIVVGMYKLTNQRFIASVRLSRIMRIFSSMGKLPSIQCMSKPCFSIRLNQVICLLAN